MKTAAYIIGLPIGIMLIPVALIIASRDFIWSFTKGLDK